MEQQIFTVTENIPLTRQVFRMRLSGPLGEPVRPGQFVNLALPGRYLRRPISICDADGDSITLIYKVLGRGTEDMSRFPPGQKLDVLTGLGNGYDTAVSGQKPLLLGGGAGIPPLYLLAKILLAEGKRPCVVLGFNTESEVFYADEFQKLGCEVTVATADGSRGVKGFVTGAMPDGYTYFYTCGPEPMLRAVYRTAKTSGQFSFEERMGCGFGACMGCSRKTADGCKRVCKDGPVFRKEEIVWES